MDDFCCLQSRSVDEPLSATCARVDLWVALEYRGAWSSKAVDDALLPARLREQLVALEDRVANVRVQLIRRPQTLDRTLTCVLARSRAPASAVAIEVEGYDELAAHDLYAMGQSLIAGNEVAFGRPLRHPAVLVCTNGKRDQCCAKWGMPVYERLAADHPELDVWQTTHLGGHRFAATLVWLPEGICFGRIEPSEVAELVGGMQRRRLYRLDRYRGRSAYDDGEQALEQAARERTGAIGFDAVAVESLAEASADRIRGRVTVYETALDLELVSEAGERPTLPSCGKAPAVFRRWRSV